MKAPPDTGSPGPDSTPDMDDGKSQEFSDRRVEEVKKEIREILASLERIEVQ